MDSTSLVNVVSQGRRAGNQADSWVYNTETVIFPHHSLTESSSKCVNHNNLILILPLLVGRPHWGSAEGPLWADWVIQLHTSLSSSSVIVCCCCCQSEMAANNFRTFYISLVYFNLSANYENNWVKTWTKSTNQNQSGSECLQHSCDADPTQHGL